MKIECQVCLQWKKAINSLTHHFIYRANWFLIFSSRPHFPTIKSHSGCPLYLSGLFVISGISSVSLRSGGFLRFLICNKCILSIIIRYIVISEITQFQVWFLALPEGLSCWIQSQSNRVVCTRRFAPRTANAARYARSGRKSTSNYYGKWTEVHDWIYFFLIWS